MLEVLLLLVTQAVLIQCFDRIVIYAESKKTKKAV